MQRLNRATKLAAFSVALCVMAACSAGVQPQPFDGPIWSASAQVIQDNPRLAMAKFLVQTRALAGKSRVQVIKHLGAADQESPGGDCQLLYFLGAFPNSLGPDPAMLCIRLGTDGLVASYEVIEA